MTELIYKGLSKLPVKQRQRIYAHFFLGMSKADMRRGEYQSVICPYGYRKSAGGRMEPKEDVAGIVRQIFEWAADGNTAAEITRRLYAMNIPAPGEYRRDKGKDHCSSTVLRMLEDQRYIGTYVIGKRRVQEIGSRRMKLKDESEWFKIPDRHPAIVSMEQAALDKQGGLVILLPQRDWRGRRRSYHANVAVMYEA
ncbi:hypothetical protein C809_03935 [Lachnospiraceae bacterium MD335]|nr:hypothetical protein C809_03935 [Lachnospiraceae bacterium MD335]